MWPDARSRKLHQGLAFQAPSKTTMGHRLCLKSPKGLQYPLEEPLHPFHPEDRVLLKTWKEQGPENQLAEKWTGPYDVLLITHTALKLPRVTPWIHHTPVKQTPLEKTPKSIQSAWTCALTENLKLFFKKLLRRTRKVVKGL